MTEIEKLKSDLEKLYAAYNVTKDMNCENIGLGIKSLCDMLEKEISTQNKDPFTDAKRIISGWLINPYYNDTFERTVAEYVRYLENQISELSEDNKSAVNKFEYQLQMQHENYEKIIKVLKENLEYQSELKQIYREDLRKNGEYYCLKNSDGQIYRHLFNTVAIFATLEEAEFAAKHISNTGFEASVYTRNS